MTLDAQLRAFFERYAQFYNDAISGQPDLEAIEAQYTSPFLGVAPGVVRAGEQGEEFRSTLEQGFRYYVSIGTKQLAVRDVEVIAIDELHALAKVSYRASHIRPRDGEAIDLDFTLGYLLQRRDETWLVFAFVAGDEMAMYEQHDLKPLEDPSRS
jgi:hypothetical protein